jgi:hypothetical protein
MTSLVPLPTHRPASSLCLSPTNVPLVSAHRGGEKQGPGRGGAPIQRTVHVIYSKAHGVSILKSLVLQLFLIRAAQHVAPCFAPHPSVSVSQQRLTHPNAQANGRLQGPVPRIFARRLPLDASKRRWHGRVPIHSELPQGLTCCERADLARVRSWGDGRHCEEGSSIRRRGYWAWWLTSSSASRKKGRHAVSSDKSILFATLSYLGSRVLPSASLPESSPALATGRA